MLKLGEKVIYESKGNFELGTFGKLPIGDKKILITNLGNIIIEETTKLFKKEELKKYYYSYSQHKQKFSIRLEGSIIVLQHNELYFQILDGSTQQTTPYKLVIKLSFEQFKNLCENQREVIADFYDDRSIFKIDNKDLILGSVQRVDNKFILDNGFNTFEINLNDIEKCHVEERDININGYFYDKSKDTISRDVYIFTNNKNLSENLEERVNTNKKIGVLPNESSIYYGSVCGTIEDIDYKNTEVFIVKYNGNLIFINKEGKNKIVSSNINNSSKLILHNDKFAFFDGKNIFIIHTSSDSKNKLGLNLLEDIHSENIGFTQKSMPFFIKHDETYFSIFKSPNKKIIDIKNKEIKDIIINNEDEKIHSDFTQVEIRFDLNKININLRSHIIPQIMKDVFVYSKSAMIKKSSIPSMYMNWAKSVNDMILFNFFGNIYYTKMEIDNILSKEITDEDKANIVNTLYYQIQSQKNQFDIISAYMPKAIEQGEVELFNKYNVKLDKKVFKILQKQLFSLASQVNRHLAEIERSLSQLSFVIYSEFNTREFNTKIKSKQAGIGMAVSVASTLVMGGGLSIPFLAMQGMNLYSNKKIDENSKEIESSKLNLFTNQAIEKLNHLIDNMYPYYVNEANDNLRELFMSLGKQYENHSNEAIKEILFDRIANIYVSKQMTLNNMTNIRKKDLVEDIYKTIDSNINTYDTNVFLIGSNF